MQNPERAEHLNLLLKSPILAAAGIDACRALARTCRVSTLRQRQLVPDPSQPEQRNKVHLLLHGVVALLTPHAPAGEGTLVRLARGPQLLDDSALSGAPGSAPCALALTPALTVAIERQRYLGLLLSHPLMGVQHLRQVAFELGQQRMLRQLCPTAEQRLAALVLALAEMLGQPAAQGELVLQAGLDQHEAVQWLGTSRRELAQLLAAMGRRVGMCWVGEQIHLRGREALERLAGPARGLYGAGESAGRLPAALAARTQAHRQPAGQHERRRHRRFAALMSAQVNTRSELASGTVTNISAGGLFVRTPARLSAGETLTLVLGEGVCQGARVVRRCGANRGYGCVLAEPRQADGTLAALVS